MGREVRRVPKNWEHPKDAEGNFIPLFEGNMPDWPDSEKTHWQMYEDTTEGTPISPVMESPEALAQWLADNKASFFGDITTNYEHWLDICHGGLGLPVLGD